MTEKQKKTIADLLIWMDLKICGEAGILNEMGFSALIMLDKGDFSDHARRHNLIERCLDMLNMEEEG